MDTEQAATLRTLLARSRVVALGVLADGVPYVGLLPFVAAADGGALYVHASRLARHTRGLGDGAPWSALVHAPDDPAADPLQLPRVTLSGTVRPVVAGTPEHDAARARYLERFPGSAATFELADFGLYALVLRDGRLVTGFARARDVSRADLARALAP